MADPINTGPNGFEIDGQQELFDVGLPEPAHLESPYGTRKPGIDTSAAFVDAQGVPKDLTKVTKTTLSQYLSKVTKGQEGSTPIPNKYPVDPAYNPLSIKTGDGNPALQSPAGAPPLNSAAFAPEPTDLSVMSNNYAALSPGFKKGKATKTGTDGHDLLPGLPGDSSFTADLGTTTGTAAKNPKPVKGHADTTGLVKPYVSAVLSQNRFSVAGTNAGQQAFTDTGGGSDAGFNPSLTQQTKLGVYDPKAPTVTPGRLASIGPLLTMRAGKELGAASDGADPNSGALQAGAILPGFGQLGITRIDQQVLLASDVIKGLTTDELDSKFVLSVGSVSWGQLNNTDDPYSGTDALGMLALSIALVAGVELVFDALSLILGLITPSTKMPSRDAQGRYTLGEYFAGSKKGAKAASGGIGGALSAIASLNFGALLGIQPTNFPFKKALSTGTNAFFQVPDDAGIGGQLLGALSSSVDSPGFNVVVARAIIRSSLTIVDQLKKIGGNIMNAITQILALIDTIRNSKIIAACNVFAMLGDAILSNPAKWKDSDQPNKTSAMDSYSNDLPGASVSKSRLQGSLKLAWASNRAAANLLLPASILGLDTALNGKKLGAFSPFFGVGGDGLSKVTSTLVNASALGRIDPDTAASFEKNLEASYVPFYFHDIRTNEMVAFHAFLASITDDYTATYDKSEGFGRVEPVKTYKGTERRINMSFYIAATSLADFDDMWIKINKLVTLVYPQFTQGVQLSSADGSTYKFTQPFSQLIGASPLIRIRLGDLLRSNYSQFSLGRLFGMGNQDFQVGSGGPFVGADSLAQGDVDNLAQALQKAQDNPSAEIYTPAHSSYPLFDDKGSGGGLSLPTPPLPGGIGGNSGPKFASQFQPDAAFFEIKAKQLSPDNPLVLVGEVQFRTDEAFQKYFSKNKAALTDKYDNPDVIKTRYVGGKYLFPVTSLTMTDKSEATVVAKLSTLSSIVSSNSGFVTDVSAFLDPSKNALAKSFKDTGGKGLAGFIETMNFDWYDKVTWEIQDGRVAPKLCKVTIGFSPIHDITPGLDHQGFNRAPLYPVGVMGPR